MQSDRAQGADDSRQPVLTGLARLVGLWRGRALGLAVLALCLAVDIGAVGENHALQRQLFDLYQRLHPRERVSDLAVIVAIDERSIARLGQWPWPRARVAQLIDRIGTAGAAVIGLDILFLEPEQQSPRRALEGAADLPAAVRAALAGLPDHDILLAGAIARWPVVLGLAGTRHSAGLGGVPRLSPLGFDDALLVTALPRFPGADQSIPELVRAASGQGLLNAVEDADAIIRRVPLVALVGERPAPSFAVEMLAVALGGRVTVAGDADGITGVRIGDWFMPTARDGSFRVPFTPPFAARYVSAVDVLEDDATAAMLAGAVTMVGLTGQGLIDFPTSPLHFKAPGIDVHAQVVEAAHEEYFIARPGWARAVELAALALAGLLFVFVLPLLRPVLGVPLVLATLLAMLGGGVVAFRAWQVLLDTTGAALTGILTGIAMLAATLVIANAHRRVLAANLQRQREERARLQGELDAARDIQLGLLPRVEDAIAADARLSLAAFLEPARDVGGDLYDFFMIDDDRLFVAIGDVSGKGLPASLFMAISKALYKSSVLRDRSAIDAIMMRANAEISRENPNFLFVTLFAGVLDLASGHMSFCNAGHEPPLLFRPGQPGIAAVDGGGGPPVCVMDDFPYMADELWLQPGQMLLLTTDGIGEAMNAAGELYGNDRLHAVVAASDAATDAATLTDRVYADVKRHAAGAEPSDDITILALRWRPPNQVEN